MSNEQQQQQHDPTLIWAPDVIENVSTLELDLYLKFSSTACIPGGGCNVEEALDVLYKCHGDIKQATKKLLMRETKEVVIWTLEEVQMFEHLFRKQPKNFISISKDLKTKSVKDCVEFYYLWKQQQQQPHQYQYHYLQHHQSTLIPQLKHEQDELDQHDQHLEQQQQHQNLLFQQQLESAQQLEQLQSAQQLEQLPKVIIEQQHQQQSSQPQSQSQQELKPDQEQFPCKVCGQIFLKIKSRSAHMKRHKNERLYNISQK
jgi:hypothetical protein